MTAAHAADSLGIATVEASVHHTERVCVSCDRGSPKSALAAKFPAVSFDHIDEVCCMCLLSTTATAVDRVELSS